MTGSGELRPPREWVDAVTALFIEHDLAPLLVDPAEVHQVGGRWRLDPWRRREDVTAVLEWAAHLEAPISIWRTGADRAGIALHGSLAGHPTLLAGCSHRLPVEDLVTLSLEVLQQVGRQEQCEVSGQLEEPALSIEQQVDPLGLVLPRRVPGASMVGAAAGSGAGFGSWFGEGGR